MSRTIGIDLGTTNTACAFVDGDEPVMIPNDRGRFVTPSVVGFSEHGEVLVGEAAKNQAVARPDHTVSEVKRAIGSVDGWEIDGDRYRPEDVSAIILRAVRRDAEAFLGQDVQRAVITVPAHFGERERRATIEAGRIAGLRNTRLLNEPTAAALCYAQRSASLSRVLVYDLGGGTFDVTCLLKDGDLYTVRSTSGDRRLGGVDFDRMLHEHVCDHMEQQIGFSLREHPFVMQQLMELVERAKIELSTQETTTVALPFFGTDTGPVHVSTSINRQQFVALVEPLVRRSVKLTMQTLRESGFGVEGVDALVLSGGSSRIPLVREYLQRALGLEHVSQVNPDEVVARGAALYAAMLESGDARIQVTDVTAFDLGVESEGGAAVPVISRNTAIPVTRKRLFTTVTDDQQSVEIHVVQGNQARAQANVSLGRFLLTGIRAGRSGEPRIEVSFDIDVDGKVSVSAKDLDTGAAQEITVRLAPERENVADASSSDDIELLAGLRARAQMFYEQVRGDVDARLANELEYFLRAADEALEQGDQELAGDVCIGLDTLVRELRTLLRTAEVADVEV